MDELLGCGLLLYVPRAWLSELFQLVISTDILSQAGFYDDDGVRLIQVTGSKEFYIIQDLNRISTVLFNMIIIFTP